MKKKILRAGIIGCGRIASLFATDAKRRGAVTHAQAYLGNDAYNLVGAADLNKERLSDFLNKWEIKSGYEDYRKMVKNENLDMVSICTPEETHFDIAKNVIESGVKAVLCEKPLVITLSHADELEALVKSSGVVFGVNHSRRWDPFHQKIAQSIREGQLGEIQTIDAYYTGGIANTGSHLIDLIRMLSGLEIVRVQAYPSKLVKEKDPTVDVVMDLSNGKQCFLHGLEGKQYLIFEVDIYGAEGRVRVEDSGFSARLWKRGEHRRFSGYSGLLPSEHGFGDGLTGIFENTMNNFFGAIGMDETTACTVTDGKATVEIILAIQKSLKENSRVVTLPLDDRTLSFEG